MSKEELINELLQEIHYLETIAENLTQYDPKLWSDIEELREQLTEIWFGEEYDE
jgi:hypothetical protein